MTFLRSALVFGLTAATLAGCASYPVMREDSVKRAATPVFMLERKIPSSLFIFEARERVYQRGQPATLYIEGDGFAYQDAETVSDNPTPLDPVALRLATQDGSPNVIWVARPCQYVKGWSKGKECPKDYWTTKRFAPEVLDSYNQALDNIKAHYGVPSFNLVGYDGGAAIAGILASQRKDILSLRTVAGNLDPKTTAQVHKHAYTEDSLTPIDFAPALATLPQRHFIGKMDRVTPPVVFNNFAQSMANAECLNVSLVDNADHVLGWAEQWKVLLGMPLDCANPPAPVLFDPTPLDGDKYKAKKKK